MKRTLVYCIFFCGLSAFLQAQTTDPAVIATSGGTGSKNDVTIQWTLGESFIQTLQASQIQLTEGFNQPTITITLLDDYSKVNQNNQLKDQLQIKIFPNPTTDLLTIHSDSHDEMTIELWSLEGQLVTKKSITSGRENFIDMSKLSSGNYLLNITSIEGTIQETHLVTKLK